MGNFAHVSLQTYQHWTPLCDVSFSRSRDPVRVWKPRAHGCTMQKEQHSFAREVCHAKDVRTACSPFPRGLVHLWNPYDEYPFPEALTSSSQFSSTYERIGRMRPVRIDPTPLDLASVSRSSSAVLGFRWWSQETDGGTLDPVVYEHRGSDLIGDTDAPHL